MRKILLTIPIAAMVLSMPVLAQDGAELLKTHRCLACHKADSKSIGPSWQAIAERYAGQKDAAAKISNSVKEGSKGIWKDAGFRAAMPAQKKAPEADIKVMSEYILGLAAKK